MSKTFGQASFQRTDVASGATIDLTAVTTRRVRITGSTGPVTSILMNAWQMLDVVFASTPTLNHGAALDVAFNGNNRPVQANDTCTLAADGSSNVTIWNFQPHTTATRLNLSQNGIIDFGGACNIAESGDAINFNNAAAGYVFNGGKVIVGRSGVCLQLIEGSDVASVQVATFEGDRATPTNGDEAYVSGYLAPSTGANVEFMRLGWSAADVTAGSVDGTAFLSLPVNSTMAKRFLFTPTVFSANANAVASLGTISVGFTAAYLSSGGFVDFGAGDVRISNLAAGTMDFGGATAGYLFGDAATDMISLLPGGATNQILVRRDATLPIGLHMQTAGINLVNNGIIVRYSFGRTGTGTIDATAGEMSTLATDDWSTSGKRSAKYRFNAILANTLNVEFDIGKGVTVRPAAGIPAGGDLNIGYKATATTDGATPPQHTFGVFFGSGAPTLVAAKGSLYLRSDGSATNNRAYIATDSAGTWTNLTTAA